MTTEPEAIPAETELLPCPFCDGAPDWINGGPGNHFIMCTSCRVSTDDTSLERCIAAWNRRASRAPVNGAGWRPIETAPKDGTVIDLLGDGERWTDCRWGAPEHCCGEAGQYCDSDWHGAPEGWVWTTMNEFLPSEEPPTHWMPLPAAPGTHPAPASPDAEMVEEGRRIARLETAAQFLLWARDSGKNVDDAREAWDTLRAALSKHESDRS